MFDVDRLSTAWAIFQGLLLEALPFLLLGVAIAGLARWLVPQTAWVQRLPRNPLLAPITGALMGFALVCSRRKHGAGLLPRLLLPLLPLALPFPGCLPLREWRFRPSVFREYPASFAV